MPATSVDAVVVSHAHLDHCGYLPALVRQGFKGPILMTADTAALAEIVLRDSAKLQMEDAKYASSRGYSKHRSPKPLYNADDVERTLPLIRIVEFDTPEAVADRILVRLPPAGHILGSTSPVLSVEQVTIAFSGDLGRRNHPLLKPAPPPPAASAIVVESTYGDRVHPPHPEDALAQAISRTAERGGSVVIPAFAVDRTELLLLALQDLTRAGRIPRLPIFVDSPMAVAATALGKHAEAERLYADSLTGMYADDAQLLLGRANALIELNRPAEALPLLEKLGASTRTPNRQGPQSPGRAATTPLKVIEHSRIDFL